MVDAKYRKHRTKAIKKLVRTVTRLHNDFEEFVEAILDVCGE